MRHCVQSFLRLTEEWRLVTDAGGGFDSSGCDTAWAETGGVASLLLARGARGWSS